MRSKILFLLFVLLSIHSLAQQKPVWVFDLLHGTVDSLPLLAYDTSIQSEQTG